MEGLGHWLRRRWYHCQSKKAVAETELQELGIPEHQLRSEWAAQVVEQTKPAPRMFHFVFANLYSTDYEGYEGRSKNKGKQAVEAILALEEASEMQRKTITKLEALLVTSDLTDTANLVQQLQDARQHSSNIEEGLRRKKAVLGVGEQANLVKLKQDLFLRLRMNALALKQRIRDRLRQRKFEIEKFERSYRHGTNHKNVLILFYSI